MDRMFTDSETLALHAAHGVYGECLESDTSLMSRHIEAPSNGFPVELDNLPSAVSWRVDNLPESGNRPCH